MNAFSVDGSEGLCEWIGTLDLLSVTVSTMESKVGVDEGKLEL